jgi:hypothetical protein
MPRVNTLGNFGSFAPFVKDFPPFSLLREGLRRVSMGGSQGDREIEPEPWPNSPDSIVDFKVCEDRRVDGKEGLTWLGEGRGGGHEGVRRGDAVSIPQKGS